MNRPELSDAKIIAIDIETYDPNLSLGPGVYRDDGCILGVSIATDTGFSEYYNIGHRGITQEERDANLAYLAHVLGTDIPKVGANILYDIDWLENWEGSEIKVNGILHDVQIAEPLLDEYAIHYNLDALSKKYLGAGKRKETPEKICEEHGWKGDFRQHLWKMRYEDTRDYAIGDAEYPIRILRKQLELLRSEGLDELYAMEIGLSRLLLKMRKCGVRISEENREKARSRLKEERDVLETELFEELGEFNWRSSSQIASILDSLGISYDVKEDTGNPVIDKEYLESVNNPIAQKILRGRSIDNILNTFIEQSFTKHCVNGRIHCTFKQVRREDGGTVSGRFSSSDPNLQAIPSRDDEFSSLCRSCFVPEENCRWGKIDYSQIEYRFIAHYARGERAEEIRNRYKNNPDTDYHQLIMDWTDVDRFTAKRLNFGMAYFMGAKSMAKKFHYTLDEARALQDKYMENVPFMGPTRQAVVNVGKGRGYIHTILGRRARVSEDMKNRKKEYVLFNRLIQGSAADLLKKAMYDAWNAGLFDTLMPHLTVHDELDVSVPNTAEGMEAYKELKHIMESCVSLKVPIIADAEIGDSWGSTNAL